MALPRTWPALGALLRDVAPGLALVALAATAVMGLVAAGVPVPPLPGAILAGIIMGNVFPMPEATRAGLRFASRTLLRGGIVLLGLRVAVVDVAELGWPAVLLVLCTVGLAFAGVLAAARALGLPGAAGLLTGAGFAICGASAVAATQALIGADEDEVAIALGNVLAFGTLSMVLFPLVAGAAGLDAATAGMWMGASINDVGQSVAAGGALGAAALQATVVVKLGRVALLGPLLVGISVALRRRGAMAGDANGKRPPLVPLFVLGFGGAIVLANWAQVPQAALTAAGTAGQALLMMALFALGTDVRWQRLRRLGIRPLVLGASAWLAMGALTFGGVLLAGPA